MVLSFFCSAADPQPNFPQCTALRRAGKARVMHQNRSRGSLASSFPATYRDAVAARGHALFLRSEQQASWLGLLAERLFGTTLLIATRANHVLFTDHATIRDIRRQLTTILPHFPPCAAAPSYSQTPEPPGGTIRTTEGGRFVATCEIQTIYVDGDHRSYAGGITRTTNRGEIVRNRLHIRLYVGYNRGTLRRISVAFARKGGYPG